MLFVRTVICFIECQKNVYYFLVFPCISVTLNEGYGHSNWNNPVECGGDCKPKECERNRFMNI